MFASCSVYFASMDTLSSCVSSLKVPALSQTNSEFCRFKSTTYAATNRPQQPQAQVSSTTIPNFVPKTKPVSHNKCSPFLVSSSSNTSPLKPSSRIFHQQPVTGYAAALIDVAQRNNSLHLVQNDVQRLLKFLQHEIKGQAVKQVVQQGNFHRHLAALLKMLLKKNMMGILQEVLEEFERIYDELCGTQVVLVSSKTKMGEDELFGIAKSVQRLSGAVRVKVRNLVHESLPSFAQ